LLAANDGRLKDCEEEDFMISRSEDFVEEDLIGFEFMI